MKFIENQAVVKQKGLPAISLLTLVFLMAGCAGVGPRHVPQDRFEYNQALAESSRHQMLLNLVRIRYLEEPAFLSVSSILTQYVYDVGAGVGTDVDLGGGTDTASANANLRYGERPTITYIPIEGREFSEHMLSAIPPETIFAAAQQGWSADILMRIGINRIGNVENMGFEPVTAWRIFDLPAKLKQEVDKLKKFQHAIKLLTILADVEGFEMRIVNENGTDVAYLLFTNNAPVDTQSLINEFKQALGLSPHRNIFRITDRVTDVKDDEITVQTRSLGAMMAFLAKGVEVPPDHLAEGRTIDYLIPTTEKDLIPFRMISSEQPPVDAFAAVKYEGYWFYINHNDIESKRSLGLVIAIFRILAPSTGGVAPVLTLPSG